MLAGDAPSSGVAAAPSWPVVWGNVGAPFDRARVAKISWWIPLRPIAIWDVDLPSGGRRALHDSLKVDRWIGIRPLTLDTALGIMIIRDGNFTRGFGYPSDIRPVGYGFGHEI
jgi:hypothetical protein